MLKAKTMYHYVLSILYSVIIMIPINFQVLHFDPSCNCIPADEGGHDIRLENYIIRIYSYDKM